MDLVAVDLNGKAVDADLWVVTPRSITSLESPGVPGTADDPIFQRSVGQGSSHVWTEIVNRLIGPVLVKNGDHTTIDLVRSALACGDVAYFGDGREL